jgi:hypothetical protein
MRSVIANALRFMGAKTEVLVAAPDITTTVAAAEPAPQA